MWFTEDI